MVTIRRELAENLIDALCELLAEIRDSSAYPRYKIRCDIYETEIAELKKAIEKDDSLPDAVETKTDLPPFSAVKKEMGDLSTRTELAAARLCYLAIRRLINRLDFVSYCRDCQNCRNNHGDGTTCAFVGACDSGSYWVKA